MNMNKTTISIVLIIMFFIVGLMIISNKVGQKPAPVVTSAPSLKNISVKVGSDTFNLVNGKAEIEVAPGSATKNTLMLFGEPVMGDLDGDGDVDAALLFVNNPGGSGAFFYAVLAINNSGAYKATEAMLLGDRIAPQTVEIHEGRAVYNFAVRKVGEPFSVQPSVGRSVWVNYDPKKNQIGEWVKDFEGEVGATKVSYKNTKYSFFINLPETWKGFSVLENNWTGMSQGATEGNNYISEVGPLILIRHPLWTEKNPRQDIPVMVFTIDQWNKMQNDAFHIGAAPINPSELGRNSKYVFALPARYNFSYLTGFEEVDQIIRNNSLHSF